MLAREAGRAGRPTVRLSTTPAVAKLTGMRDFNTAGPVRPGRHYCIPPLERLDLDEVLGLIRGERYFVLHAPRQTGKTSALLALRDLLNGGTVGEYRCLYANAEPGQAAREDVGAAVGALLKTISLESHGVPGGGSAAGIAESLVPVSQPHSALAEFLVRWCAADPRPVVLMIDEIDSLVGDTLVSVLRQLRAFHPGRPERFPQSVILCGVRDVRDYRIRAGSASEPVAGGSAFNIKAESLRMGDFTRAEVETLLGQHTTDTGQKFAPAALEAVWRQTRGQPWLVNALGKELCFERQRLRPRARPISARDVSEAREALILRRDTHIDQLADKLREPRVRRVIEPLLSGGDGRHSDRDVEYVRDLGLVAESPPLRIANPIYGEVLPRVLTSVLRDEMPAHDPAWYVDADGGLDLDGLLHAFQTFWRRNSEHWVERARYTEAGPHLVLQAFLHRVVNGRGRIEREYALGSRRVDLLLVWPDGPGRESRFVVECKLLKGGRSRSSVVDEGLEQTAAYMDLCGTDAGHLILFDMRAGRSWADRIRREERRWGEASITVWGA